MSYQYLVHKNISKNQVIEQYEKFTYPSFRQKSSVRNLIEPFFVVEATYEGQRVGLAVLELVSEKNIVKVLSLYVTPNYERRGIATQLLKIAEQIARNNQFGILHILFQDNWKSYKAMPKLLNGMGWNKPDKKLILVKLRDEHIKELSWFQIQGYPEHFSSTQWTQLEENEYSYIRLRQQTENWYPEALSPFQLPNLLEPNGSLVLRYKNEIVGWFIVHRTSEKNVQLTAYFIDPAHRNTRATMSLINESIRKIEAISKNDWLFMIEANNEKTLSLAKKIAGKGSVEAFTEVWASHKTL